jgi:HSP90 family molecular chaperone
MAEYADAYPSKRFFIHMITRDIRMRDCILDLIDNCLDGAGRLIQARKSKPQEKERYSGFRIELELNDKTFSISDNCGGIGVERAKKEAFHFGSENGATRKLKQSIGLYGIGMKRAIFKIGREIQISSSTDRDAFNMPINVDEWERDKSKEWKFKMDLVEPSKPAGTKVKATVLTAEASIQFADTVFLTDLRNCIARDYSFFLQRGLEIVLNREPVRPYEFCLRESEYFKPLKIRYDDEGVTVEITAGLAGIPPDEPSEDERLPKTEYYGWFVSCNERVVLAADKSDKTVWGQDDFKIWHPQYNGFMGIAAFTSEDPTKLPWTTTKRDVDDQNRIYRRAVARMKQATEQFIAYTSTRKGDLDKAKQLENAAQLKPVKKVAASTRMVFPSLVKARTPSEYTTISYQRRKSEIRAVAKSLGDERMPNYRVGEETFLYYKQHELGE